MTATTSDWTFFFVTLNTCLLLVAISFGVVILMAGLHARATLNEALAGIKALLGTAVRYLEMGKEMTRAAHVTQQGAARTIEEVPEKTADKVVQKITEQATKGDSGVLR